MARISPEHLIQVQIIERVRLELALVRFPILQGPDFLETGALRLFAVPNGGLRAIQEAVRLKAEGTQRGVPDLMLPIPRHGFAGLFLELKAPRGTTSPEQRDWLAFLAAVGYAVAVAWSTDEAFEVVASYINPEPCERWAAREPQTFKPGRGTTR